MRCGENENSWAWISPSGDFIEVNDHAMYALDSQYRREIIEGMLYKDEGYNHPLKLLTPTGWRSQGCDEYVRVSEKYYRLMVDHLISLPEHTDYIEHPAPKPPESRVKSYVSFSLSPAVMKDTEVERRLMPNLSTGTWTSLSRLTRSEERFLEKCDDEYVDWREERVLHTEGVTQSMKNAWVMLGWYFIHHSRGPANEYMREQGWLQATNAFAVSGRNGTVKQWDVFFTEAVNCYRKQDPVPMTGWFGDFMGTFGEAMERFASPKTVERLFGVLLERFHHKGAKMTLRGSLIRLAYCNDEIRSAVLPMLQSREAVEAASIKADYKKLDAFSRKFGLSIGAWWDYVGLFYGDLSSVESRKDEITIPHGDSIIAKYVKGYEQRRLEYYVVYSLEGYSRSNPYMSVIPVMRFPVASGGMGYDSFEISLAGIPRLPKGEAALASILKHNVKQHEQNDRYRNLDRVPSYP